MKKLKLLIILGFMLLTLSGCIHKSRTGSGRLKPGSLIHISIGMDKKRVIKELGEPDIVRGSLIDQAGQIIEVWEYSIAKGYTSEQVGVAIILTVCTLGLAAPLLFGDGQIDTYWLYFREGKLVKWCRAGDWEKEANYVQEIRFR